MVDKVWIPVDDGGRMEVPADDPRAIAYQREWLNNQPKPKPSSNSLPKPKPRQTTNGIYTVQPGDTLGSIAKELLGESKEWGTIAKLNQLKNPNQILVGQRLVLPNLERRRDSAAASSDLNGIIPGSIRPATFDPFASNYDAPNFEPGNFSRGFSPSNGQGASVSLASGWHFIVFEQLPEFGTGARLIRKVAVVPKNYAIPPFGLPPVRAPGVGGLWPALRSGTISPVEHVMNTAPASSPFLSASDRAIASASIEGTPLLIDVAKVKAAGGNVLTVEELVFQLRAFGHENPQSAVQIEKLIWTISKVEGEVLIGGGVPSGAAAKITGPAHLRQIKEAEKLWNSFKDSTEGMVPSEKAAAQAKLEADLLALEARYGKARTVGRFGRVLTVAGVIVTAVELGIATNESVKQQSIKPLGAEVLRQVGGWGGAVAGAKIGAVVGAGFGIETGPGAIITGAVGALVFGWLGYQGFDLMADEISPN